MKMTSSSGETACLACLLESGGEAGLTESCDTAGILGAIVGVISSLQTAEETKIMEGKWDALHGRLLSCDVWTGRFQSVRGARNAECRACVRREFTYLAGQAQPHLTMCGRDSVQVHERARRLDLGELRARLAATVEEVRNNAYLLRFRVPPSEMTVFTGCRAIITGTTDPSLARSLYA